MSPYEALTDATQTPRTTDPTGPPPTQSFARIAYRQLVRNKLAMVGFALIVIVATIAVWVPFLANDKPYVIYATMKDDYEEAYYSWRDAYLKMVELYGPPIRTAQGIPQESLESILPLANANIERMKQQLDESSAKRLDEVWNTYAGRLTMWIGLKTADPSGPRKELAKAVATIDSEFGPDSVTLTPRYYFPLIRALRPLEIFFIIIWFAAIAQWLLRHREPPTRARVFRTVALAAAVALFWGWMVPYRAEPVGYYKQILTKDTFALFPPVYFGETEGILEDMKEPPTWWPEILPKDRDDGYYHVLGTDTIGRDVLSRMIYGARIAMIIGFVAVSIYVVIGIFLGAMAGYFRGAVDMIISRVIEIVICFPTLFLILIVMAYLRASIINIMVVIGLTSWTGVARLTRGEFFRLVSLDYVSAIQALGGSTPRIIFRHILPNGIGPVLVVASFGIASAVLIESALSFLALGVPPPAASWGTLLFEGRSDILGSWWLTVFPGVAIFLTVTAWNLFGEGLRDAIDPRLKQ
jgi:peptide/nickel transport system permease protein